MGSGAVRRGATGMTAPTDGLTSWRTLIADAMTEAGETWDDVLATTLDDAGLDARFDASLGIFEGAPFTLWTRRRVYFPVVYDGSEWVGSVARFPCDEASKHHGGE